MHWLHVYAKYEGYKKTRMVYLTESPSARCVGGVRHTPQNPNRLPQTVNVPCGRGPRTGRGPFAFLVLSGLAKFC